MAWIIIPLQYLFLIWRAQTLTQKAESSAGKRNHNARLRKAANAVIACETMQHRFPLVTSWIDMRRNEQALRLEMRK